MTAANAVRGGIVAAFLFLTGSASAQTELPDCGPAKAERHLVDAILSRDPLPDPPLGSTPNTDHFLIPSLGYYQALHRWYGAYQDKDSAGKRNALDGLRKAVKQLDRALAGRSALDRDLALGLAHGHLARALLEGEHYVEGYRQGVRAREGLLRFLDTAPETHPGRADAGLLSGLYEVYTHDLQNRFHWLLGTIKYRGDRERGIRLIEQAISNNAIFATEALRALLGEVSWRLPDFCRYTELLESTARKFPRNTDLAVLSQGLLLRCGFSQQARALNDWLSSEENAFPDNAVLDRARLRILADLGSVDTLHQHAPKASDTHHRLYLAYAQDVAGARQEATRIYQELAESSHRDDPVRRVSEVRLQYPYRPPSATIVDQFHPQSCGG